MGVVVVVGVPWLDLFDLCFSNICCACSASAFFFAIASYMVARGDLAGSLSNASTLFSSSSISCIKDALICAASFNS